MKKILLFTFLGICLGTLILASCLPGASSTSNKSGMSSLEVGVPNEVKGRFSKIEFTATSDNAGSECSVGTKTITSGQDKITIDLDLIVNCFPYTFNMIIWNESGQQWYHGSARYNSAVAGEPLDVEIPLTKVSSSLAGQSSIGASTTNQSTTTSTPSTSTPSSSTN